MQGSPYKTHWSLRVIPVCKLLAPLMTNVAAACLWSPVISESALCMNSLLIRIVQAVHCK